GTLDAPLGAGLLAMASAETAQGWGL
ncbi:MAG: hypothetical protein JWP42_1969, partial [Pseudomonas sp.]|nr:hypothetical protein [Pseudomonas sp.]